MSSMYIEFANNAFMNWIEDKNEFSLLTAYENVTMAYTFALNDMDSDLVKEYYTYQTFLYEMIGRMLMK